MQQARRAIDALQNAGFEASSIALAGEAGAAAARMADASANTSHGDSRMIWRVVWRGFWWSIAGAIAGAAVGFGLAKSGLPFPASSDNVALQVASWTMFLHVGGAIVGVYLGISSGAAWELTFQPVAGPVAIAVRSLDARGLARAERILRDRGATDVRRPAAGAGD